MKTLKDHNETGLPTEQSAEAQGAEKLTLTIRRTKRLRAAVKAGPTTSGGWTLAETPELQNQ
jgi:hypothetical protein